MNEQKESRKKAKTPNVFTRRGFVAGVGSAVLGPGLASSQGEEIARLGRPDGLEAIRLTVNGISHDLVVEARWTLAEVLRDRLGLTGTKIGCNAGECGACTVLLEGKNVLSCSQLAVWMNGKKITTVEGLVVSGKLDPLQEAFIEHDAPQCGYCTPGQLMSAKALLSHNPHPTREEVQHGLTGNLCRCSNYNRIVEAVLAASQKA